MATSAVSTAGWVISVCLMRSCMARSVSSLSPPLVNRTSVSFSPTSSVMILSASAKVSATTWYFWPRSLSMSTYCAPCPGKRKAILGRCAARRPTNRLLGLKDGGVFSQTGVLAPSTRAIFSRRRSPDSAARESTYSPPEAWKARLVW